MSVSLEIIHWIASNPLPTLGIIGLVAFGYWLARVLDMV